MNLNKQVDSGQRVNQVLGGSTPQSQGFGGNQAMAQTPDYGHPMARQQFGSGQYGQPIHSSGSLDHKRGMPRGGPHQDSETSLAIGASHNKETWERMTANQQMEEAVADRHRGPANLEGLTKFLRDEYYRKLGVYINKSDDESGKLITFWKNHVSDVYRKRREEQIAARQSGSGMMSPDSIDRGQKGSQQRGKENQEMNRSGILLKYQEYGLAFELDVADTVAKDLQQEKSEENEYELAAVERQQKDQEQRVTNQNVWKMTKMMELTMFGPPMTAVWEEDYIKQLDLMPCPDRMNFTVVSYPSDNPWPTQWDRRKDGKWDRREEKDREVKKRAKMQPPVPFQGVDVKKLKVPQEDTTNLGYFGTLLDYYKELRNGEKLRERDLRNHYADAIPLKKIELIESQYVQTAVKSNHGDLNCLICKKNLGYKRANCSKCDKGADGKDSAPFKPCNQDFCEDCAGKIPYAKEYYEHFCHLRSQKLDQENHFRKFYGCYDDTQRKQFDKGLDFFKRQQDDIKRISVSPEDQRFQNAQGMRLKEDFFTRKQWIYRLILHKCFVAKSMKTPLSQHYMSLSVEDRGAFLLDCPETGVKKAEITKILQDFERHENRVQQHLRVNNMEKQRNEQARKDFKVTSAVLRQAEEIRVEGADHAPKVNRTNVLADRMTGMLKGYDYNGGITLGQDPKCPTCRKILKFNPLERGYANCGVCKEQQPKDDLVSCQPCDYDLCGKCRDHECPKCHKKFTLDATQLTNKTCDNCREKTMETVSCQPCHFTFCYKCMQNQPNIPKARDPKVARNERMNELAKPKDKWKVGKELLKLQEKFPHDRVLQRMVKDEFKTNQPFRNPEEYDIYSKDKENPCKFFDKKKGRGRDKLDKNPFAALDRDLEKHQKDMADFAPFDQKHKNMSSQKNNDKKANNNRLEQHLHAHAWAYLEEVAKRGDLEQGERTTVRTSLKSVWESLEASPDREALLTRFPVYREPGATKSQQPYPESFKRYFFRLVKCISETKKGKTLSVKQVKKNMKNLPTMFMVAGKQTSHNKRIQMTKMIKTEGQRHVEGLRTKVFHRQDHDIKEALQQVFMTADEQENCHFEPKIGSLYDHTIYNRKKPPTADDIPSATYYQKFGENFQKNSDTKYLWKLGCLRRCQVEFNRGNYDKAWTMIMNNFNVDSLRKIDAPLDMEKATQMVKKALAAKFQLNKAKREQASVGDLHRNEADNQGEFSDKQMEAFGLYKTGKNTSEKWWAENAGLIYNPPAEAAELDGEVTAEDTVLGRINREVYELIKAIEKHRDDKVRNVKRLEQRRAELKNARDNNSKSDPGDTLEASAVLFKTIMCPLKDRCSKVQKIRWPYSSIKSIVRFGANCPYAHHGMELNFRQSMNSRINATETAMNSQVQASKTNLIHGREFYPGGHTEGGPHVQKYDAEGEYQTMMKNKKEADKKKKEKRQELIEDGDVMAETGGQLAKLKEQMESAHQLMEDSASDRGVMNKAKMFGDENFCKKFGYLKKGCVLMFYQRYNDAFDELAKAVNIIKYQKELEKEKMDLVKQRWCFKLDLDEGFELPYAIDKVHPDDISDRELSKKIETGGGTSIAKVRLFWEKISPFKLAEGSRDTFLNMQIEEAFMKCEGVLANKFETIKQMKSNVQKLEELAEQMDEFDSEDGEGEDEEFDEDDIEGQMLRRKKRPSKMCKKFMETGKCKEREAYNKAKRQPKRHDKSQPKVPSDCSYAHNALELDIIPKEATNPDPTKIHDKRDRMVKTMARASQSAQVSWSFPAAKNTYDQKSKNLKSIVTKQSRLLKSNKSIKPFVPPSYGGIEDPAMFAPYEYHEPYNEEENKEEEAKQRFYERDNVFRKPFEEQD